MLGNKKPSILKRKVPSISALSSNTTNDEYHRKYIIDPHSHFKQQRYPHVMKVFCNSSQLEPVQNELPTTHLKPLSHLSIYAPTSNEEQLELALLWSLTDALFSNTLRKWLTKMLQPEFEHHQVSKTSNPWERVYLYTCYCQLELACDSLEQMNETKLAALLKQHNDKNTASTVANMTKDLKDQGKWESISRYQQKIMYALMGDELDSAVMENLSWKSKLAMYLLFTQDCAHAKALEQFTSRYNDHDKQCLWYQLLQWWFLNNNDDAMSQWPLDFVWLLTIYKPNHFKSNEYALKWIDELQTMEEYEYAIYASLFLQKQRKDKVRELLRGCELVNEERLLHQFHIPADWIQIAKALHAHDDFDFESEYTHLLRGNLEKHAKMALMLSLLPQLFNDGSNIESSLRYIEQYSNQDDLEIKALNDIYRFLATKQQGDAKTLLAKIDQLELAFEHSASFNRLCEQLTSAIKAFI